MKKKNPVLVLILCVLSAGAMLHPAQKNTWKMISAAKMKFHLRFLAAPEFAGRNTPSAGLGIASRYLALQAELIGLKPLMPGGSYFQEVPFAMATIAEKRSHIRILGKAGEQTFFFPEAFGASPHNAIPGAAAGRPVCIGLGAIAPMLNWNDFAGVDLKGKVVLVLNLPLPVGHPLHAAVDSRGYTTQLSRNAYEAGAVAVLTVISPEREKRLTEKGVTFANNPAVHFADDELEQKAVYFPYSPPPIFQLEIRHDTAAAILGIGRNELEQMFADIAAGKRTPAREAADRMVEIVIGIDKRNETSPNVVACLEGSDPQLKNEYVVIGAHHDHLGPSEGRIFPGSDDNASGSVAMLEIARAMMSERPRRSVIFLWPTAEEKGLKGAYYFVIHCPVPVGKISAMLNMDMLTRNDPGSIYVIGSNKLSSELDQSIRRMNEQSARFRLDYKFQDPGHPDRFFFRSDHYPFIRYGVPGVWFFSGTTTDYHQETDTVERADWGKMEKFAKLLYLTALDIGNRERLLKLNIDPRITSRGEHNMKIEWWKALEEKK